MRAQARWVLATASVGGLGYLPWAPGTWGTLAALPLWWGAARWPMSLRLGAACLLTVVAIAISARAERLLGGHDSKHIVIDEVAGMCWAAQGLAFDGPSVAVAFVAFRLLDALKPPPIGWVDRQVPGGLGVVLDDVVAGVLACGLTHGLLAVARGGWAWT